MGYSHYWTLHRGPIDDDTWAAIQTEVGRILSRNPRGVCRSSLDQADPPICDGARILFGTTDDLIGGEDFAFVRPRGELDQPQSGFCKTGAEDHDTTVVATLLVLKRHLGKALSLRSDGIWADWRDGRRLVRRLLGYTDDNLRAAARDFEDARDPYLWAHALFEGVELPRSVQCALREQLTDQLCDTFGLRFADAALVMFPADFPPRIETDAESCHRLRVTLNAGIREVWVDEATIGWRPTPEHPDGFVAWFESFPDDGLAAYLNGLT